MTIVKELNELAYKMTGVNPKAKTDQQALNYIEQNYKECSKMIDLGTITWVKNEDTEGEYSYTPSSDSSNFNKILNVKVGDYITLTSNADLTGEIKKDQPITFTITGKKDSPQWSYCEYSGAFINYWGETVGIVALKIEISAYEAHTTIVLYTNTIYVS